MVRDRVEGVDERKLKRLKRGVEQVEEDRRKFKKLRGLKRWVEKVEEDRRILSKLSQLGPKVIACKPELRKTV